MNDIIDKSEIIHELDNYEKGKGSWVYSEVNGVRTKVYTKYLTGTTAAGAMTTVAHGIADHHKMFPPIGSVADAAGSYMVYDYNAAVSATYTYRFYYNAINILINNVGAPLQSQNYRIEIKWYE